jgi:predicted nuclease of predicted toxin-antitoxin system
MEILLDQGMPRTAVAHLKAFGFAAVHVGDLDMATATDEEILTAARQRNAIVVTMDADFHRQLAVTRERSPSVVRIRIEGMKGLQLASLVAQVVQTADVDLQAGAVVSVTEASIRIRRLPLI